MVLKNTEWGWWLMVLLRLRPLVPGLRPSFCTRLWSVREFGEMAGRVRPTLRACHDREAVLLQAMSLDRRESAGEAALGRQPIKDNC